MKNIQDIVEYALDALKKAGADKASCVASKGRKDEFNVEANQFSLLRTLYNDQLSIKAIKDNKKGETSVNKLDKDSIDKAVEECISLANASAPDPAFDIAPKVENKSFDQRIGEPDKDKLFDRTKEFLEQVQKEYPEIIMGGMSSDFTGGESFYLNSNGAAFGRKAEHYVYGAWFSAKEKDKVSSMSSGGARCASLNVPFMDIGLMRTLLEESVKSLDTDMVDGKFVGKIIVTPACEDMIWHTLLQNFLGDRALIEKTSRWKDALGTKVADSKLTFRAAPHHPDIVAGERITGDGFEAVDTDYIKDGVLNSFALSLYGANKTGKPRAGAHSGLEVAAGDVPLADMIKGVEQGVLLNRFSGASPGPSGDMSGIAKNSFLIENGKVTKALKETMISFNIVDILRDIPAISKERSCDGGVILPWCCFDGVTVSGK